jgi:hypothetical protein
MTIIKSAAMIAPAAKIGPRSFMMPFLNSGTVRALNKD